MYVEVLNSDPYLKQSGGQEICFRMLTLVKTNGLGGTRVGTYIFLTRERSSVPHVTKGGMGSPKPMKLGFSKFGCWGEHR